MTKQTINIGSSPNKGDGDPLRTAFTKINDNFTELYDAIGLGDDTLNIGSFEFNGSTLTTTDSSRIEIAQEVRITSDLTMRGSIVPNIDNHFDLGSPTNQWRSLYVSNNTIYIGGTAVGINGSGELTVGGNTVSGGGGGSTNQLTNGAYSLVLGSNGALTANLQGIVSSNQISFSGTELTQINVADGPYINCWNQSGTQYIALVAHDGASAFPTWKFDTSGDITLPGNTAKIAAAAGTLTLFADADSNNGVSIASGYTDVINAGSVRIISDTDNNEYTWTFGSDGTLTLPGTGTIRTAFGAMSINAPSGSSNLSIKSNDATTYMIVGNGSAGVTAGSYNWQFSNTGNLTFPDSTVQTTAWTGLPSYFNGDMSGSVFADDSTLLVDGVNGKIVGPIDTATITASNLNLNISARNYVFVDSNEGGSIVLGLSASSGPVLVGRAGGIFTVESDTYLNGSLRVSGDIKSEREINIDINLSDSTLRRWTFGEDGVLNISGGGSIAKTNQGLTLNGPRLDDFYGAGESWPTLSNGVSINTQRPILGGSKDYEWLFAWDGGLYAPTNTDSLYTVAGNIEWRQANAILGYSWSSGQSEPDGMKLTTTGGKTIQISTGNNHWLYGTDGSLKIPGDIRTENAINIDINLSDSTLRRWTFGEDGVLNIPGGIISSDTIEISNTGAGVAQDINIYSADNILLQGADRTAAGNPEGGDINIYAGDGAPDDGVLNSSSGGDLEIFAGRGGNGSATGFAGPGGNIDIQAGNGGSDNGGGGGDGGNISISAGDATNAAQDRGHISITSGGGGDETTNGGYVEITIPSAGTHPGGNWLFSGAGNVFEVPADAEIICVNNGGITVGTFNHPTNITVQNTFTTSTYTWAFDDDGTMTFPDSTVQSTAFTLSPTLNVLKIDDGVHEKFQELADATGTVTHDCSSGHIFYHASPDANWTVNLTNLNLSTGYATTVTIIIDQGGTGYYPSALQIGGSAQTINWQGNATPTPSSSRHDVVTFSILAFAGGYTVFGQMTGF